MLSVLFALFLQSAPAATAMPASATGSVQAMFEAATAAYNRNDYAGAVQGYEAVERRLGSKSGRSRAISQVRRGSALIELGRIDEAGTALRAGYAALPADDATLAEDRYHAAMALGRIAATRLDYAGAQAMFADAVRLAPGPEARIAPLVSLSRVSTFDRPEVALARADEALAIAVALPKPDKPLIGQLRTQRGRVLLNQHVYGAARAELMKATMELGGLGNRVDGADMEVRSDLAIAALLAGDQEDARKYLSYTGAGHLDTAFAIGADMSPPPCGGEDGILPTDTAVVEFGIRPDGSVEGARPIYASRSGPMAVAFAKAVGGWSWRPDQIAKVKPFFRAMTRVQLRCSTVVERPSLWIVAEAALARWLAEHHVAPVTIEGGEAATLPLLKAELARRMAQEPANPLATLPVLVRLSNNKANNSEDMTDWVNRSTAIADAAGAPPLVRILLDFRYMPAGPSGARSDSAIQQIMQMPEVAADPQALATLRLVRAGYVGKAEALQMYRQVAGDPRLASTDPLRVAANLGLATAEAKVGDLEAARTAYQSTGLDAQQCALVDLKPVLKRSGASSGDFPMEAMRWGFEGWVAAEYDIDAQGRTLNQRAVVSYPPFVFEAATLGIAREMRFEQRFRPDGGLGCSGASTRVAYRLP